MGEVRDTSGRVDVLLHAAGLEISRSLPDKEPREYDLVFDVKSDGWFNVLHAMGDMPIGATVAFSSVAGRFGNVGQTDYSAANDLLCKLTSNLRRTRPRHARDRARLDGVGRHRHGDPRLDPEGHAAGGHRDARPRGRHRLDPPRAHERRRRGARSRGRRARAAMADEFDETGGIEAGTVPRPSRPDARHGRGGRRLQRRWSCARRSTRSGSRSSTITASTAPPCCPASWASRRSRRWRGCSHRAGTWSRSRTSTSSRR